MIFISCSHHCLRFIDLQPGIVQSLAFHLMKKMRNIRRLAVTVWSFLNSCESDTTSSEIA
ncbi:hypothetical protein C3369_18255 [Escherichia sp. ESNIH1]|nr:hypothetical protein C3369_18255 [Escherichia sp. ESNIH1]